MFWGPVRLRIKAEDGLDQGSKPCRTGPSLAAVRGNSALATIVNMVLQVRVNNTWLKFRGRWPAPPCCAFTWPPERRSWRSRRRRCLSAWSACGFRGVGVPLEAIVAVPKCQRCRRMPNRPTKLTQTPQTSQTLHKNTNTPTSHVILPRKRRGQGLGPRSLRRKGPGEHRTGQCPPGSDRQGELSLMAWGGGGGGAGALMRVGHGTRCFCSCKAQGSQAEP